LIPAMHAALTGMNGVPSTVRVRAHKHAWRVLHFTVELMKIARCFEQRGIEFLAHKGPVLGQLLYGNPAMRQFGDLDVMVRPRDFALAKDALIQHRLSPWPPEAFSPPGEILFALWLRVLVRPEFRTQPG
jgi:hypothetical protein